MAATEKTESAESVADIPGFPFRTFRDLQQAISDGRVSLGVDPLAAAQWSDEFNSRFNRTMVGALSVLLFAGALASVVVAVAARSYWLLLAVPIMAIAFYLSHPASPFRKWVTIGGAVSVAVFIDLILNRLAEPALLVAYAGLTFAAVRAAGFIANSRFRKAVLRDEASFVDAYMHLKCNLREKETERVYVHRGPAA